MCSEKMIIILQDDLSNHYQTMKPSIAKMLEKSWAPVFYEEIFCKINEEIYAPYTA